MIDLGTLARALHILSVVVWIGGVSFVATALLPAIKQKASEEWINDFDEVERRFAPQARVAVLIVLLSGLYMLYAYDLWDRFADVHFWWMHLMVGVWTIFAGLLFVVEPLSIRRAVGRSPSQAILTRLLWTHRLLLVLSLAAIFAAVGGSHGWF